MSPAPLSTTANRVSWAAQLVVAAIFAMTSFTKLTGNAGAVAMFDTLGVEPWGRYLVGLLELAALVLLVRPATAARGGLLAIFIMIGALGAHFTRLGISINGDPSIFIMALIVLAGGITVVLLRKRDLAFLAGRS
jgi:apolipoprotein N-acyltransferase